MRAPLRAIWLTMTLLTAITVAACARPSPTVPAPPDQILPAVTGLTISGVPASFGYGQSVQLTAIVTLPDGAQKQTLDAVWQSSDKSVASVSDTGLLVVTGFGDADVTATVQHQKATAHVTLPKPPSPPPVARLDVTIDSRGSNRAIAGVSEVTFDLSRSAGVGLRYDVDFGDGASSSGTSIALHVYRSDSNVFIAAGRVTDGFGRSQTTTKEVVVISLRGTDGGTWQSREKQEHRLRFNVQGGPQVTGEYWNVNDPLLKRHPFTGTIGPDGHMRLVLDDQSMTFDGQMMTNGLTSQGPGVLYDTHLLLTIYGGAADGSPFDFTYRDAY